MNQLSPVARPSLVGRAYAALVGPALPVVLGVVVLAGLLAATLHGLSAEMHRARPDAPVWLTLATAVGVEGATLALVVASTRLARLGVRSRLPALGIALVVLVSGATNTSASLTGLLGERPTVAAMASADPWLLVEGVALGVLLPLLVIVLARTTELVAATEVETVEREQARVRQAAMREAKVEERERNRRESRKTKTRRFLEAAARDPAASISDLARRAGCSRDTAHRALRQHGIERDDAGVLVIPDELARAV